jgi:hypothetical protein
VARVVSRCEHLKSPLKNDLGYHRQKRGALNILRAVNLPFGNVIECENSHTQQKRETTRARPMAIPALSFTTLFVTHAQLMLACGHSLRGVLVISTGRYTLNSLA